MDCIFCKIINGEIPCSKVYDDNIFIGFLDIRPIHKGHVLIVPKKHFVNIFDTPADVAAEIYSVLKTVSAAVKTASGCDAVNIVQNNGADAGQEVFHSHVHIIPRFKDDGLKFATRHAEYDGFDEMNAMAARIRELI